MNGTTSILDLPTDPAGGGNIGNNITISSAEQKVPFAEPLTAPQNGVSLDPTVINQIISGLQQASNNGLTQLPSRDIPMTTTQITHDPNVQPTYIPPANTQQNYIDDETSAEEIIQNYNNSVNRENTLDEMYSELQTPLLLAILFFLFQLPIFKKYMFQFLPALFAKDGNMNLSGFVFTSSLFGLIFYFVNKITSHFNTF